MATKEQLTIAQDLAGYVNNPLAACLYGFPWGSGELMDSGGPRAWQAEVLRQIAST